MQLTAFMCSTVCIGFYGDDNDEFAEFFPVALCVRFTNLHIIYGKFPSVIIPLDSTVGQSWPRTAFRPVLGPISLTPFLTIFDKYSPETVSNEFLFKMTVANDDLSSFILAVWHRNVFFILL